MKKNLLKFLFVASFILFATSLFSQAPQGYYKTIDGKKNSAIKTALFGVIQSPKVTNYTTIWTSFQTTDKKANGKVWDMYSDVPNGTAPYEFTFGSAQCGNYKAEADCYNREHSFPKSWFGDQSPMDCDIHHIYPTDGYVNSKRSNDPFGEVGVASWTSKNGSKSGKNTAGSYTGTVFEPIDAYKGDFARSYFYMVTAYEDKVADWSSPMLSNNKYPAYTQWAIDLLLKWHREDPVSAKEINRNNAVYAIQGNRNPFIDHPELAEYIWGTKTSEVYSLDPSNPGTDPGEDLTVQLIPITTFKQTLEPFVATSVRGDQTWLADAQYGAKMSGYVGGANLENENWLISPSFDLTDVESALLSFSHTINKGNINNMEANHTLWISSDYGTATRATSDLSTGNWEQLTISTYPDGGNWNFVSADNIEIPTTFLGKNNVRIAFKYLCSTSESATWEITNLALVGTRKASSIDDTQSDNDVVISANGHNIEVEFNSIAVANIQVYDLVGNLIVNANANQGLNLLPIAKEGVYIVRVGSIVAKVYVK